MKHGAANPCELGAKDGSPLGVAAEIRATVKHGPDLEGAGVPVN